MSRCRDAQAGSVSAYFVGSTRKSPTMRQPAVPKMIWGRAGNEKEQGRALAAPDKARSRLVARGAVHDISLLAVGKREESSSPTREQGDTKQQGPTRESGALLVRWGAVLKQGSGALAHACSNTGILQRPSHTHRQPSGLADRHTDGNLAADLVRHAVRLQPAGRHRHLPHALLGHQLARNIRHLAHFFLRHVLAAPALDYLALLLRHHLADGVRNPAHLLLGYHDALPLGHQLAVVFADHLASGVRHHLHALLPDEFALAAGDHLAVLLADHLATPVRHPL